MASPVEVASPPDAGRPGGHSLADYAIVNTAAQPVQRAVDDPDLPGEAPLKSDRGQPLPDAFRDKMEAAFKADFSDVRVHHGSEASRLKARAYTQGKDIFFAPGKFHPASHEGQKLLAHELTHVVQQRAGQVAMPEGGGAPINADSSLESAADQAGEKAVRGEAAWPSTPAGSPAPAAAAVQRDPEDEPEGGGGSSGGGSGLSTIVQVGQTDRHAVQSVVGAAQAAQDASRLVSSDRSATERLDDSAALVQHGTGAVSHGISAYSSYTGSSAPPLASQLSAVSSGASALRQFGTAYGQHSQLRGLEREREHPEEADLELGHGGHHTGHTPILDADIEEARRQRNSSLITGTGSAVAASAPLLSAVHPALGYGASMAPYGAMAINASRDPRPVGTQVSEDYVGPATTAVNSALDPIAERVSDFAHGRTREEVEDMV